MNVFRLYDLKNKWSQNDALLLVLKTGRFVSLHTVIMLVCYYFTNPFKHMSSCLIMSEERYPDSSPLAY